MKLLGLDFGAAKVGLAIADTDSRIATPYQIIRYQHRTDLFQRLQDICHREKIDQIVVGVPLSDPQTTSAQLLVVQKFNQELSRRLALPVLEQDERFTTQAAQRLSPGQPDDAIAAMLILQSFLDRQV